MARFAESNRSWSELLDRARVLIGNAIKSWRVVAGCARRRDETLKARVRRRGERKRGRERRESNRSARVTGKEREERRRGVAAAAASVNWLDWRGSRKQNVSAGRRWRRQLCDTPARCLLRWSAARSRRQTLVACRLPFCSQLSASIRWVVWFVSQARTRHRIPEDFN